MLISLEDIFCVIDDFCKEFQQYEIKLKLTNAKRKRYKASKMSLSEIMTIVILFHISHYRTFKHYYIDCVQRSLKSYFPQAVSYNRFVELMAISLMPLSIFLYGIRGKETGIYFADSTSLEVCHLKREKKHKVFKGYASKGKNSMGWFYGLKLHLVINNEGELMSVTITRANVDDRSPLPKLLKKLSGWLFADRGYLGQPLIEKLKAQAIDIFTKVRRNMKQKAMSETQQFLLSKRGIIETVIDQLKNCCYIEHTRHRSPINAFVNLISGLVAYCFKPRKPSIKLHKLTRYIPSLISS